MKPAALDATQNPRTLAMLILLAAVILNGLQSPVTIKTYPRALFQGGTVRLLCRIDPDARNRQLNMGIVNYRDSEFPVEGKDAPAAYQVYYEHMPCEGTISYCSLTRETGKVLTVTEELTVGGCDQSTR